MSDQETVPQSESAFDHVVWLRTMSAELGEPEEAFLSPGMFSAQVMGESPSKEMVDNIREIGVIQPPTVFLNPDGSYSLVDGRRRMAAAAAAGLDVVRCNAYAPPKKAAKGAKSALTIALNALRSDNPVSEYEAVSALVKDGLTHKDICKLTGMSPGTLKRRLRLGALDPGLMKIGKTGEINAGVLEAAAKLPVEDQKKLAKVAKEREKVGEKPLTTADVAEARQVDRTTAIGEIPTAAFASGDAPTDEATVGTVLKLIARATAKVEAIDDDTLRNAARYLIAVAVEGIEAELAQLSVRRKGIPPATYEAEGQQDDESVPEGSGVVEATATEADGSALPDEGSVGVGDYSTEPVYGDDSGYEATVYDYETVES